MPLELLTQLKARLSGMARRGLTDSPEVIAELLVLLRMVLADGEMRPRQSEILRRIAAARFGLGGADGNAFMQSMREFGQVVGAGQTTVFFRGLDIERRRLLARRLTDLMEQDRELKGREARFRARLLALLDLTPDDLLDPAVE